MLRQLGNLVSLVVSMLSGVVVGFFCVPFVVETAEGYDHGPMERIPYVFCCAIGGVLAGLVVWRKVLRI
jgi:hypothetical protein